MQTKPDQGRLQGQSGGETPSGYRNVDGWVEEGMAGSQKWILTGLIGVKIQGYLHRTPKLIEP